MNKDILPLTQLRKYMHQNNLDAYIIPMTDPHMSEYVADHWQKILPACGQIRAILFKLPNN